FVWFAGTTNTDPVVRARLGASAELDCSLAALSDGITTPNLYPPHVVEWVRLGYSVPILIKFGGYVPRVHPSYKGRVSLARGASLVVDRLTLEDEGWFECRILLLDRTSDEFRNGTWTFLSIAAPPVFLRTPPAFLEVLLGESLTLSCGAHGSPMPTVTWRKDGGKVESHDKIQVVNASLCLTGVTREMAGVYKCHVSNSEGNLTHITQLQVKGPPVIIVPPEDTTMNMSQDAFLQCRADAYPSNLTYEWWKEGENVYHIESLKLRVKVLVDGTLVIPSVIPEDSGNYTCIPTNGLLTPPSATAHLKVKHPARVVRMPGETYLPVGMGGTVVCPVQAEPPMLFVNWTKDGLSLDLYPGWTVNSEGSVFIAIANDDAVGTYTCTAYNSYGTMGQSEPTKVILEDPPSFQVAPRSEYLQEVGRDLMIPCQAFGDPSPNITWVKVAADPRSPYAILSNGSLVLRPLSKDHHGAWECRATNLVISIPHSHFKCMGFCTSPHVVTGVSVDPGMNHANVSWEPGFDGGYTQMFTIWVKPTARGEHEWVSLPVPASKSSLLVTDLRADTSYQFSILPQNKLGSGPFSEIVTTRTRDPPTIVTTFTALLPPTSLSINRTVVGVLLQWTAPPHESPPITAFVLQARQEKSQWVTLDEAININGCRKVWSTYWHQFKVLSVFLPIFF
uniref:Immunoglobulin superfamily, member 9b n=1 Tax=Electrophorus electricus TaxID=8005 RepID=A0A4W4FA11_ELEEL